MNSFSRCRQCGGNCTMYILCMSLSKEGTSKDNGSGTQKQQVFYSQAWGYCFQCLVIFLYTFNKKRDKHLTLLGVKASPEKLVEYINPLSLVCFETTNSGYSSTSVFLSHGKHIGPLKRITNFNWSGCACRHVLTFTIKFNP